MSEGTTGIWAVDALVVWSIAAAAVAGAGALLWRVTRSVRRVAARVEDFIEDWTGAPPRPGVPARQGVMERLGTIEQQLSTVAHEVRPNGGSSMRDAINRVDERTARIAPDDE
jgi:hypothetical protein